MGTNLDYGTRSTDVMTAVCDFAKSPFSPTSGNKDASLALHKSLSANSTIYT